MRWALVWLGIGFLWKWTQECLQGLKERCKAWKKQWEAGKEAMFDAFLVSLSFALIYIVFGVLHVTTGQAFWAFAFWSLIIIVIKAK